ncbi:Autophagy-related protein 3 [Penicillium cinerascens]|uniref:Ubiquitin-like-conjugating enzyme ATG10 n=1 Tax=Penicillium cinerascens TaxID=70096 RepID=A0A9W9MAX6_9EURO|nr:Autophagy-related protein 3 [Penicillium cinerascens]KAJ5195129.1 Autophagy-related protein 3 [Penicillium cinerascens]
MASALSAFPFLTAGDFEWACRDLADRTCGCGGWSSVRLVTENDTYLRITRCVDVLDTIEGPELREAQELEDEDPVCKPPSVHGKARTWTTFDDAHSSFLTGGAVFSPTYQVPVLYFTLRWHNHQGPLGLDAVYQYVVPEQYRKELKGVGVIGGISFGYHPASGAPAFFVHPCNTADAMAQIADARSVTPGTYLIIWLGLVGHCVNLHVPRELVASDDPSPS